MAANRGYKTVKVPLASTELTLRGSTKLVNAVKAMTGDMSLYEGVKFAQILEAVYAQGKKDGARAVFEGIDLSLADVKKEIPHRNPGRPPAKRKGR